MFAARAILQGLAEDFEGGPWAHLKPLVTLSLFTLGQLLRKGKLDEVDSLELLGTLSQFIASDLDRDVPAIKMRPNHAGQATPEASSLQLASPGGQAPAAAHKNPFTALDSVNETRLGEVLISMGLITSMELDRALVLQRVTEGRLGEILLGMDLLATPQLDQALQRQRDMTLQMTNQRGGSRPENGGYNRRQG